MGRIIIIFFIFTLTIWQSAFALDNPEQKMENVVRSYVIARYPDWSGLEIKITFKNADKIFKL